MTPFSSNPHLSKTTPNQHQQATSGSVQLSVSKTYHLKIILLLQIGFLMDTETKESGSI
jgi:hypothetical protein